MNESIGHDEFSRKESKNNSNKNKGENLSCNGSNNNQLISNRVNISGSLHNSSRNNKNFILDDDITFLELLYKNHIKNSELVEKLYKVIDCSILKYGVNPSFENIPYSFCKTCDKNLINPICEACINKCHKGHKIVSNFEKGKIKCSCGEKMHIIKTVLEKNIDYCLFNEWANLSKINIKYKNKNKQLVCIFCHYICNKSEVIEKKIRNSSLAEIDNKCYCTDITAHNDFKEILTKLLEMFSIKKNGYKILKLPTQIINMIFKCTKNFCVIFSDFYNFFNFKNNNTLEVDFLNENFIKTSLYITLEVFMNLFKESTLSYYCQEAEKYFSFNNLKILMCSLQKLYFNEKSYFLFIKDFMFLFRKAYIERKLCNYFEINKICDLENLSCIQRIILFRNKEKNRFIESSDIILFLIQTLKNFEINTNVSVEIVEYLKDIISIFKKLSTFNLIKVNEMIQICRYIELILKKINVYNSNNLLKNTDDIYNIELKLLNNMLKMMIFFIYHNNDKIIYNTIFNDEKSSSLKNITQDKICFTLTKSVIGNFINKLTIRILFILQKYYAERDKTKLYQKTCNNAIKILNFSLISNDNYMINIIQSLKFIRRNPSFFYITNTSETQKYYYQSIINSKDIIENGYYEYLNFIIDEAQLIDLINKSLDTIFEDTITLEQFEKNIDELDVKFSEEKNLAIIDSQFFFSISKIFIILFKNKLTDNESNEKILLAKKILYFYFLFINKSAENSILILSSSILDKIIKVPKECSLLLFNLLYHCFNNIFLYDGFIINFSYTIKIIYGYLETLPLFDDDFDDNYENDIKKCVYYFMQILKTIVYNIKLTYKCDDFINLIKNIISNISFKFKLPIKYYKLKIDERKKKSNGILIRQTDLDEKVNSIYNVFLIYIKLINDIFDFSLEKERKIITRIINVDILIFGLSNFVLNLDERSEYIRFIRKMILDVNYCEKKEHLYTSFIINNRDNLSFIKNNFLVENLKYPTKLLSFKKEFYKISEMLITQEKNIRKKNREQTFQLLSKNIINFISKDNEASKIVCSSKSIYNILTNGSKDILKSNYRFSSIIKKSMHHPKLSAINIKSNFKNRSSNFIPNLKPMAKAMRKSANYINKSNNNKLNDTTNHNISNNSETLIENENNEKQNQSLTKHHKFNNINNSYNKNDITIKSIVKKEKKELRSKYFNVEFHLLLLDEIEFINNYTINIKIDTKEKIEELRNYFENALLIPIIYYFKRVFIYINLYTGYEIEIIYTLLVKCINLKKKISRYNIDFWEKYHDDLNEDDGELNNINDNLFCENFRNIYLNESCIDGSCFVDPKLIKETEKSLNGFSKNRGSIYDYTKLYQIVQKEFFSLVKSGKKYSKFNLFKENRLEHNFRTKDDYFFLIQEMIKKNEKKIVNYDKNTISEKKLIRIFLIYKYNKFFFSKDYNNLSLFDIFQETCIEFERNYLNLLVFFLVNNGHYSDDRELFNMRYFILLILLTYFPNEVQFRIKQFIEGKDSKNLCFMIELSQKLCQKLILFFIDYFNPQDKLSCSRHLIVFNLIKIFKYLCENYNSFFQHHLVKSLKYVYNRYIPIKYEVKHVINNTSTYSYNSSDVIDDSESLNNEMPISEISNSSIINYNNLVDLKSEITFKDFYFCVLIKILLIPDMYNKKYDPSSNESNSSLYCLLQNILEMLTLIIQGNKLELVDPLNITKTDLNISTDSNLDSNKLNIPEKISSNKVHHSSSSFSSSSSSSEQKNQKVDNYKLIKIGEPFILLIEKIIAILFERENVCLSYDLKIILVDFILSVLEEYNIRQEIRTILLRKLSIQTILNNIGNLLKKYFSNHQENNQIKKSEKLQEDIKKNLNNSIIYKTNNENEKQNIIDKNKNKNSKIELILKRMSTNSNKNKLTTNTTVKSLSTSSQIYLEHKIPSLISSKINKNIIKKQLQDENTRITTSIGENIIPKIKDFPMKNDNNTNNNCHKKKIIFDEKICQYFKTQFFKINKDFLNSKEFILANLLYKCIKILSIVHKKPEAEQLIKKTKYLLNIFDTNTNKNSDINDINEYINEYINQYIFTEKYDTRPRYSIDSIRKKRRPYPRNSTGSIISLVKVKKRDSGQERNSVVSYINNNTIEKENNIINNNDTNNISELEQFYIVKFFEAITSTIEIRTKERIKHIAIFTKLPEMKYLSEDGKLYFLEKVNRDSESIKKNELLKYLSRFIYEINYYQYNKHFLVKWFSKRKFLYYRLLSFIFAIIINFFVLFTFSGDNKISNQDTLLTREEDKLGEKYFYQNSLNKWQKYYNYFICFYMILNFYLVMIWMFFRFPLYYKLDEIKYMDLLKLKRKLKLKEKIYIIIFMTIAKRTYIYSLIFQVIVSTLSFILNNQILNTLLLLPILKLSKTIKSLIKSITLRKDSLSLTIFLAVIIIYTFSNLAFFFFRPDYEQSFKSITDNVCDSLIYCFLNAIDSGLRARGGIGDSGIRISYLRNKFHYISRTIMDVLYFLLIVIIAIDMIFGITVGNFGTFQNKILKNRIDRSENCFICHIKRKTLNYYSYEPFDEHINITHDIWKYAEYMISLIKKNTNKLNYIDSYVKMQIINKKIEWFPSYKDLINEKKDNDKCCDENEEPEILEELVANYKALLSLG